MVSEKNCFILQCRRRRAACLTIRRDFLFCSITQSYRSPASYRMLLRQYKSPKPFGSRCMVWRRSPVRRRSKQAPEFRIPFLTPERSHAVTIVPASVRYLYFIARIVPSTSSSWLYGELLTSIQYRKPYPSLYKGNPFVYRRFLAFQVHLVDFLKQQCGNAAWSVGLGARGGCTINKKIRSLAAQTGVSKFQQT